MISRYTRPEMSAIWTEECKLALWWRVELLACEAMAERGDIPEEAMAALRAAKPPAPARVAELERTTQHDVAAFVQAMEEAVGPEAGRYIHLGLTSSDILDTALAVQLRDAADLLLADLERLGKAIRRRAFEQRDTPVVGRTHGVHAEPTTVGHVLAVWYGEVQRHRERLQAARGRIAVGKLSGPVGNYGAVDPGIEAHVCRALGLIPEAAATQVVQRDRHAELFTVLALIASSVEKFAVQVRHWQRTEVLEAEEAFGRGQKGSSAMPHKKNPILSENVTGLCRLVRGYALSALESVALWHERDISHSSVERVIGPDATLALDFALARMARIVDGLEFHPEHMRRNLEQTRGLVFSGRLLVALVRDGGLSREQAYGLVQKNALEAFERKEDFEARVRRDPEVTARLDESALAACFDLRRAVARADVIFERVFGPASPGEITP